MRWIATLLCTLTLTGCLNVAKPVRLPDGSQGYTISRCRGMNSCYNKAAEVCGGKYEVIDSTTRNSGAVANGTGSSSSSFEMAVKCKN